MRGRETAKDIKSVTVDKQDKHASWLACLEKKYKRCPRDKNIPTYLRMLGCYEKKNIKSVMENNMENLEADLSKKKGHIATKNRGQPQFEKTDSKNAFSLREINLIQKNLIIKSEKKPSEWINENGENFRKIIEANPELVKLYCEDPSSAENFIEQELKKYENGNSNT